MRVYIAGALSSKEQTRRNPSEVVCDYIQNINKMCKVAAQVRRAGHAPYVPALDFLLGAIDGNFLEYHYRDTGMAFLAVCDCVLVISTSWGVKKEIERAKELGIPVFYDLDDLQHYEKTGQLRLLL